MPDYRSQNIVILLISKIDILKIIIYKNGIYLIFIKKYFFQSFSYKNKNSISK
jgi:hypothetical protein